MRREAVGGRSQLAEPLNRERPTGEAEGEKKHREERDESPIAIPSTPRPAA
jgi:hypothetical protein